MVLFEDYDMYGLQCLVDVRSLIGSILYVEFLQKKISWTISPQQAHERMNINTVDVQKIQNTTLRTT